MSWEVWIGQLNPHKKCLYIHLDKGSEEMKLWSFYLSENPYWFFRCCLSTRSNRMPWTALAKSRRPVGLSGSSLITLSTSSKSKSSISDSDSELAATGFLAFFGRRTTSSLSWSLCTSPWLVGESQFIFASSSSPSDVFFHSFFTFFSLRLGSLSRS